MATTVKRNAAATQTSSTPSLELIKQATQEVSVSDSSGRAIVLRKPGPLAQFRLVEAAGASAENRVYMAMVLPLIYVSSIDGSVVPAPATKGQLEALIQRLGDSGLECVSNAVIENFGGTSDPEADQATLKN